MAYTNKATMPDLAASPVRVSVMNILVSYARIHRCFQSTIRTKEYEVLV